MIFMALKMYHKKTFLKGYVGFYKEGANVHFPISPHKHN